MQPLIALGAGRRSSNGVASFPVSCAQRSMATITGLHWMIPFRVLHLLQVERVAQGPDSLSVGERPGELGSVPNQNCV